MTYIVKVKDYDGKNKFQIEGLRQKVIDAAAGEEIIFDQSDASNTGHPLRIALYPDGAHLGLSASEYTVGVTIQGTPGQAGAKTTFTVSDTDLHGTYFYYCSAENHRYMGGMIHYGSDSIPQVAGASQPTVPAKYRLIDEGATAYDAQDGDLTSDIVKTVESLNQSTNVWDYIWDESTTHSNPWAVQNTDTRNTVQYRIRYEVQDSQGLPDINTQAGFSKYKSIDITNNPPTTGLLTLRDNQTRAFGGSGDVTTYYNGWVSWHGAIRFGIWGWYGMNGLTTGPTASENSLDLSGFLISKTPSSSDYSGENRAFISIEVPLNTWIMIYAEGLYFPFSTGDVPAYGSYWCGNPYYEDYNGYWLTDTSRRDRMIEDSEYQNGDERSRIRFPGPSITNWDGYDANFLYPPGTNGNGGSINVHAFKGFNGEIERWNLQNQQYYYWRHNLNRNTNMAVFKILDSVTVDLNFSYVYYGM